MGVTFSQAIADPGSRWVVIVKVEGLGHYQNAGDLADASADGDGVTKFCQFFPDYANQSLPIWKKTLKGSPGTLSERGSVLGGFPDLGQLSFAIVDEDDYLTGLVKTQAEAVTSVSAAVTVGATTIFVESATNLPSTGVAFIGSEVVRINSKTATSISVTRGYLGTDALPHDLGDPVFDAMSFLRNRRVTFKLGPADAVDANQETTFGTFAISETDFEDALCTWAFMARSQLKFLSKLAPFKTRGLVIAAMRGDPTFPELFTEQIGADRLSDFRIWRGTEASDENFFLKVGQEIISAANIYSSVHVRQRGLLGTDRAEFKIGQVMTQVFVADYLGVGSFRYSPGPSPSTSRSSGTWIKHAHPLRILLTIILSSHESSDNLELNNRNNTYGAYDILPPGYGLGLPHTLIDWPEWQKLIERTSDWKLPNFVYGDDPATFTKKFSKEVLEPLGIYLVAVNGLIRPVLPDLPRQGETAVTIDTTHVLLNEVEEGRFEPRITQDIENSIQTGAVTYRSGPRGDGEDTFRNGDFGGTFGQRGHYTQSDDPITIPIPGAEPGDPMMAELAARRILLWFRPPVVITVDVTIALNALHPGDSATLTHPELVTMKGTRGWTTVYSQVLERENITPSEKEPFPYLRLRLVAWPSIKVGKICPAGYVSGVSGSIATLAANRFTDSDASGDLPTADVTPFVVGDVVRLVNLDGLDVGSGTETVDGKSGNDLTLSGDFSGNLATGRYLVYANADENTATQTDNFVHFADRALGTVGSTLGGTAWRYGSR